MRDIKFRAWDKIEKIMYYEGDDINPIYLLFNKSYEPYDDEYIIMQYTGLKDNSNKEIYEDDIIRLWTHKDEENPENDKYEDYLVYWNDGAFVVNWENEYSCCDLGYAINCWEADSTEYKDWQVIGNKFNNPELLEEK